MTRAGSWSSRPDSDQTMTYRVTLRPVDAADLDRIIMFCAANPGPGAPRGNLNHLIRDNCLLRARYRGQQVGIAGLDVGERAVAGPWVVPGPRATGFALRLLEAVERLAIQFGITRLAVFPSADGKSFFADQGYWKLGGALHGGKALGLTRSIIRRLTDYARTVSEIGSDLGIPPDYGASHRLRLQPEAVTLHSIGRDIYGRQQRMTPGAARAWNLMCRSAAEDGIDIQAVSAYRSVSYQADIIRKKLNSGQSISQILKVSAAPGYSEHHSGNAVDLTTPDSDVLEEAFEDSEAFAWLTARASGFGFHLSYPRDNRHGVIYEPWHWCHK